MQQCLNIMAIFYTVEKRRVSFVCKVSEGDVDIFPVNLFPSLAVLL